MQVDSAVLFYVHDPMCAWCWAYRPTFAKLQKLLPASISLQYLVGGLAPDTDEPMPVEQRQMIISYWQRIENLLGTEFNYDFWTQCQPRRSSYPACRAVLAAKQQNHEVAMIHALQEAYYLRALNPSDDVTHYQLAEELQLDTQQFAQDLHSDKLNALLLKELQFVRAIGVQGFPALVLQRRETYYPIPVDYQNEKNTLKAINEYC